MSPAATTTHRLRDRWAARVLRSIGAVLAGVLTSIVVVGAIDAALRAAGIYPPMFRPMAEHLWALAFSYRVAVAVGGGFLTARLAPARPMRHVMVLGGIETVLSLVYVVLNWSNPDFGPHWFALGMVILSMPSAAVGGLLHARRHVRDRQ